MTHLLPKAIAITSAVIILSTAVHAQKFTKDGTALTWEQQLTVVSGTVTVNRVAHPAHTITVFETDANTVLDLWRTEFTPISSAVGIKPPKATGVRIDKLSSEPMTVFGQSSTDKKAKLARLSLAFMVNDTTPLADAGEQEGYMRELAVALNRAVVQKQLDRYQQELDKTSTKLGSTQQDAAKTQRNLTKANSDLEKVKTKRSKLQRDNARTHGDVTTLERKFALSNDPKDLQKLTKARQKVAKSESDQAKLMQQEAKIQGNINKYQGTLEGHQQKAEGQNESKEELTRIISELKRKQDSIR